jgi:UDP-N-acetylglucosamine 2-epimerase (non-hydrolysing)
MRKLEVQNAESLKQSRMYLNISETHEHSERMEAAVMMTAPDVNRVSQALALLESQSRGVERMLRQVGDYSMPIVAEKVVRIILSFTDYMKRTVWKEY